MIVETWRVVWRNPTLARRVFVASQRAESVSVHVHIEPPRERVVFVPIEPRGRA